MIGRYLQTALYIKFSIDSKSYNEVPCVAGAIRKVRRRGGGGGWEKNTKGKSLSLISPLPPACSHFDACHVGYQ